MEEINQNKNLSLWKKLAALFERYERPVSSLALIVGFIVDSLTLRRIDLLLENLLLIFYIFVVGAAIIQINKNEAKLGDTEASSKEKKKRHFWYLVAMQFAIGGLFSAFIVFYSRSSSLEASWPFFLLLLGVFIGNEVFKKRYLELTFQMSVFYVTIFSYSILIVPVVLKSIDVYSFIISGALSILIISIFWWILTLVSREEALSVRKPLIAVVTSIFIIINILYFTNIIPPIPLSLKSAGVYHNLSFDGSNYHIEAEEKNWKNYFQSFVVFHALAGESVYVVSAVFAPTKLNTEVFHEWQFYSEEKEEWVTSSVIKLPVIGGRDRGYRGYSVKRYTFPGYWRVNVKTDRGQIIGRLKFKIEKVAEHPPLSKEVR